MPTVNYTEKVIELQDVEIKKIEKSENKTIIFVEIKRKGHECPVCGKKTNRVHDYRWQKVKDLPAFGKEVELRLHKRRYVCECGKRFCEKCEFVGKYQRRTTRTTLAILQKLEEVRSYASIAREFGVSIPNID